MCAEQEDRVRVFEQRARRCLIVMSCHTPTCLEFAAMSVLCANGQNQLASMVGLELSVGAGMFVSVCASPAALAQLLLPGCGDELLLLLLLLVESGAVGGQKIVLFGIESFGCGCAPLVTVFRRSILTGSQQLLPKSRCVVEWKKCKCINSLCAAHSPPAPQRNCTPKMSKQGRRKGGGNKAAAANLAAQIANAPPEALCLSLSLLGSIPLAQLQEGGLGS